MIASMGFGHLSTHTEMAHHILVVDDDVDGAHALARYLGTLGHATMVAHDAASALELVVKVRPTLAILEVALPFVDGYALASRLRAMIDASFPIVMLSGFASPSYRNRAAEQGINAYFTKPADLDALERALATVQR